MGYRKDFAKLWVGQSISEMGSRITREGLPLAALLTLNASAQQMGFLSAISSASVLVFGLGAGLAVDRLKKRPVMMATDLGRACLLGLIPLAASKHALSLPVLILVTVVTGALTVLFDVAYQSYLPALVAPEELLESNRRLSFSASAAEMLGPAFTGALIQVITAPRAILVDAFSFLVSAFVSTRSKSRKLHRTGDLTFLCYPRHGTGFDLFGLIQPLASYCFDPRRRSCLWA